MLFSEEKNFSLDLIPYRGIWYIYRKKKSFGENYELYQ